MARASVRAADTCRVRALSSAQVTASGQARVWAWGRASVTGLEASEIEAWGAATVMATGSGKVEARENAFGGRRIGTRAGLWSCHGAGQGPGTDRGHGRGQHHPAFAGGDGIGRARDGHRPLRHPEEWCEYYGVEVKDGVAILYKAVDEDFNSYHGASYGPGTSHTRRTGTAASGSAAAGCTSPAADVRAAAPDDSMRFVACPVRLEDMVVHPRATTPTRRRRGR